MRKIPTLRLALQLHFVVPPVHNLLVGIAAREDIIPFQLSVYKYAVQTNGVLAGGCVVLVNGKTSFSASASCAAAMMLPHKNAYSPQIAQAAMPPLDAMAFKVRRAVAFLPTFISGRHLQFDHLVPIELLLSMGTCGVSVHSVKSSVSFLGRVGARRGWIALAAVAPLRGGTLGEIECNGLGAVASRAIRPRVVTHRPFEE